MEQEYFGGKFGGFDRQEVGGTFVTARTVFASGVVPELIRGGLGEEVRFGRKDLGIEQLGFDGVVDTFDIGIGIGTGGRVEAMLGIEGLLDGEMKAFGPVVNGIPVEFNPQIGGDDNLVGVHAMLLQVFKETLDGEGRVGFGEFVAVGQELSAARQFADGVLETGQAVVLHLRPIEGDVGEMFHIHLEASEGSIGCFDRPEVVFTTVTALGGPGQLVGVQDALGGIVTQRQIKLFNEPASAKAGCFLAERDQLLFQGVFGFVRAGFGSAALRAQAGVALVAVTAEPFSDGVAEAAEVAGGRFDAFGPGELDELMAQGKMGIVSANHVVARFGGGRRMTGFIEHDLVSSDVRRRCPSFSSFLAKNFFAPRAPCPPSPLGDKGRAVSGFARDCRSHTLNPFQVR